MVRVTSPVRGLCKVGVNSCSGCALVHAADFDPLQNGRPWAACTAPVGKQLGQARLAWQ